jgi:hypothetical protein
VRDRRPAARREEMLREREQAVRENEQAFREVRGRGRETRTSAGGGNINKDLPTPPPSSSPTRGPAASPSKPVAQSPVVTLTVGKEGRVFAAHEDVLCQAPFFESACRGGTNVKSSPSPSPSSTATTTTSSTGQKRIHLPEEEPEVLSAVLEYLYKGDYYPRLLAGKQRDSWELEDAPRHGAGGSGGVAPSPLPSQPPTPQMNNSNKSSSLEAEPRKSSSSARSAATSRPEATILMAELGHHVLRDTAIYCAADRFGLDELKRLSLRKQALQSGIDVATILRSAQFAYANTPDSDSSLRAHYLALIIRCRRTFKRSSTLQADMEKGGSKLYFDLFVAMCNHLDDVIDAGNSRSPAVV